jgi:rubrerythrin
MSIFDTLLRLVDPIAHRQKQEQRRVERKGPSRPAPAGAPLICRVCGYEGGPEHRYCPRCLAETMERRR